MTYLVLIVENAGAFNGAIMDVASENFPFKDVKPSQMTNVLNEKFGNHEQALKYVGSFPYTFEFNSESLQTEEMFSKHTLTENMIAEMDTGDHRNHWKFLYLEQDGEWIIDLFD